MRLSDNLAEKLCVLGLLALAVPLPGAGGPQGAPPPRVQVAGAVTKVDASARQLILKTDTGDLVTAATADTTLIIHLSPDVTDPSKAPRMTIGEISEGDRVVAYYRGTPGQKAITATSLVVRTRADLAEIAKKELEDWHKRGTTGTVAAVDEAAKTITLKAGSRTVTVTPSEKTEYHRYSLDSAKPSDAKASTLAEIKVGDQLQVLGNRNPDATATTAEVIYAGAFRQLAATIVSVNAASGELQVKDLATKKALTIRVNPDSTLKKLDPLLAAQLARRYGAGRAQAGADSAAPAARGMRGGSGGGGRGPGGDISQTLERLPAMPLAELKAGDAVMVSTTLGSDPTKVTAIMLLAGVEPILTAAPSATRDLMGAWNLNGMGGGEGN